MIQCQEIVDVTKNGQTVNILSNYTGRSKDKSHNTIPNERLAEASMGLSITSSIDDTLRRAIVRFQELWSVQNYADGPTLLRVILMLTPLQHLSTYETTLRH